MIVKLEATESIEMELMSLGKSNHEVYEPVPLGLCSAEDQAKIIQSTWVIKPRSGIVKARFVG